MSNFLEGFDPLGAQVDGSIAGFEGVLEEANKRVVHNILKSYTGYFDVFSEIIQNALDAVELRVRSDGAAYQPQIWIEVDISEGRLRVTDNGIGMGQDELKLCLRPNVSFKKQSEGRGHKGVGATFLAYGFSFLKLQSKKGGSLLAVVLRQGRLWTEDTGNLIPRPKFQSAEFDVKELAAEKSGTSVEVLIGKSPGERPKDLGWIGAQSAQQWLDVLRIKTPLGGVYLQTAKFKPKVVLTVKSTAGSTTEVKSDNAEYFYPHEIPNLKTQSVRDIQKATASIAGDASTKFGKLSAEYKKLDAIYDIWDKTELLSADSLFATALSDDERILIEKHSITVYASFLRSAKLWTEVNDDVLKLRKGQRIIHGGLQLASDFMVQGDLSVIPLTSAIGYQANSHVVVHFVNGNPDMGRKVFQPELTKLAEQLAVRAVGIMKRFLDHMKPDTGSQVILPDKELHDWKKKQEEYRDKKPLALAPHAGDLALISEPQQEQDVIALFHELVGLRVINGLKFFATSQNERYDSLFMFDYGDTGYRFDRHENRLGVSHSIPLPSVSEPKILEYKYDFDALVADFEKDLKYVKHIDLVVCWSAGSAYKEKFYLQPLLVGDEGSDRTIFGSTHKAYQVGAHSQPAFEVLILKDLLSFMIDPAGEEARQKTKYSDS